MGLRMKDKLTLKPAIKCIDAHKSCLYFGDEYVGIIRNDIAKEMVELWAEAHIEETVAQRVSRRVVKSGKLGGSALEAIKCRVETSLGDLEYLLGTCGLSLAELLAEEEPE